MRILNVYKYLVLGFVALSSIFWLPGINEQYIAIAKNGMLIFIAIFIALFTTSSKVILNNLYTSLIKCGLYYWLSLFIVIITVNLFSSNDAITPYFEILYIIFLLTAFSLYFLIGGSFSKVVIACTVPSIIFVLLIFITLFSPLNINTPDIGGSPLFSQIGFNVSRTGWSIGLAMLFISCLTVLLDKGGISKNYIIFAMAIIIVGQIISTGRGGLLCSLVGLAYFITINDNKRLKWSLVLCLSLLLFWVVNNISLFYEMMRLDRIAEGGDVSAGRFDHYSTSLDYLIHTNFIPLGTNSYFHYFQQNGILGEGGAVYMKVHNLWLGELMQYGLLFIAIKMFWLVSIFNKINKSHGVFLLIGLLPTLFEPTVIFSTISNYSLWWLLCAYLIVGEKNMGLKSSEFTK